MSNNSSNNPRTLEQQLKLPPFIQSTLNEHEQKLLQEPIDEQNLSAVNQLTDKLLEQTDKAQTEHLKKKQQLKELHQKSYTAMQSLLNMVTSQQKAYREDARTLNESSSSMTHTQQQLHEMLDRSVIEKQLQNITENLPKRRNASSLQESTEQFFMQIEEILNDLSNQVFNHRQSIHNLYRRFQQHFGIMVIQPKPYTLQPALNAFTTIRESAKTHNKSLKRKLTGSAPSNEAFQKNIATPVTELLEKIRQEVSQWIDQSLQPLSHQIDDQRVMLDRRFEELENATQARAQLEEHLDQLNEELKQLKSLKQQLEKFEQNQLIEKTQQ